MAVGQVNVVPASTGSTLPDRIDRTDRTIGTILVAAGRLTREGLERVLQLQREGGLRFGDAATELGLLTQADVQFALSRQFDSPYLPYGESNASEDLVAAYLPSGPQAEALRALRGQLTQRWFDSQDHKALAVISAERGEGRSFIAANLAVVFSQLGARTLLIDADMRNPRQHELFGLESRNGLSAVLAGRGGPELVQSVPGLHNLSVLPAGAPPPNPLDLLARPLFASLLEQLSRQTDIILLDCPAAIHSADAETIALRTGAALVVARKDISRIWRVRGVSETVHKASTIILGTVLNDF